jgi:enterochelin esterase-like enzyme
MALGARLQASSFYDFVVAQITAGENMIEFEREPKQSRSRLLASLGFWFLLCIASLLASSAVAANANANAQSKAPKVTAGAIERIANMMSRHVDARNVDVWLPPGYEAASSSKRYAVLYMHDGQMLFDPQSTWNKQAWQIDRTLAALIASGKVRDTIVVGIWNNGKRRHSEYYPEKFLPHLPEKERALFIEKGLDAKPRADAYLRFIVEELKPMIDARYRTVTDKSGTFIAGASMGGLISVYALAEYPNVFGGAAALSTHWIGAFAKNEIFPNAALTYLRATLPSRYPAGSLKLYMDRGTTELDASYEDAQPKVDALLMSLGYREPNVISRVFEGKGHNETAWAERVSIPLAFLLAPPPPSPQVRDR